MYRPLGNGAWGRYGDRHVGCELLMILILLEVFVEPGTVDTELASHLREDVRRAAKSQVASIEALRPDDIAAAMSYRFGPQSTATDRNRSWPKCATAPH